MYIHATDLIDYFTDLILKRTVSFTYSQKPPDFATF